MSGGTIAATLRRQDAGTHRLGVLLMLASAVAFSTAGFFTRAIPLDAPPMLFWRGIFSGGTIALFLAWEYRGRLRAMLAALGWPDLVIAGIGASAMVSFLCSLRMSSVAEVSVIYATLPLVTAGLSRLVLREPVTRTTLLACGACFAGMVVMMSGGQARAHLTGDALAAGMTIISALLMVALRYWRHRDNNPALAGAALLTSVAVAAWAHPASSPLAAVAITAAFGIIQNGLGLIMMTIGARYVTATETALYGALDAPLAPLWVWLAFDEAPGVRTLVGGAVVVAAVFAFIARGGRLQGVRVGRVR